MKPNRKDKRLYLRMSAKEYDALLTKYNSFNEQKNIKQSLSSFIIFVLDKALKINQ